MSKSSWDYIELAKQHMEQPPIDRISTNHTQAWMLARRFTVQDAIRRGVCVCAENGHEVTLFDQNYSFVVMRVRNQVACEVVRGPFHAEDR